MPNIYIIDDDALKRSWLKPLLLRMGDGWKPGFSDPAKALHEPDHLLRAARAGPGNVVLLEPFLPTTPEVALEIMARLAGTPEGEMSESYYRRVGDERYRLGCCLMATCQHARTTLFIISTSRDRIKSLPAEKVLLAAGISLPPTLPWPEPTGPMAAGRRCLASTLSRFAPSPTRAETAILERASEVLVSQLDVYTAFRLDYLRLERSLSGGETWPPHNRRELFPPGDFHTLVNGSGWRSVQRVPSELSAKLNDAFSRLSQSLPKGQIPLPTGDLPLSDYWPLWAARGIHEGRVSLRFIEWLLGENCVPPSEPFDAVRLVNDAHNAEFIAALCFIAKNDPPFALKIAKSEDTLQFSFLSACPDAVAAEKAVCSMNQNPTERASLPNRNGRPGTVTLARYKLERFASPGNFVATAKGEAIVITGKVALTSLS